MSNLGQGYDAEMDAVFIDVREPIQDACIGLWSRRFRHDVGVEQEAHSSTLLGLSFRRTSLISESRSGEEAKNSARFPLRFVLRSHSSAATTTTAVRPRR